MNAYNKPVRIEKIVNGGFGLGRLDDGRVVLVGKVLPDELVTITITEDKKQYLAAEIAAILEPHPARIKPPCRWYGTCGGCDLQHCDYPEQLRIKTAIIRDLALRRFPDSGAELHPLLRDILPSPIQFGYRQRIRLQVDTRRQDGVFGFSIPPDHPDRVLSRRGRRIEYGPGRTPPKCRMRRNSEKLPGD